MFTLLNATSTILLIVFVSTLIKWRFDPLYKIPTVGPSFPLLSYIGAFRYYKDARGVLQEGYTKYKIFKVAMLDQWVVVVSGARMHEELCKVPDSHATFHKAAQQLLSVRYTMSASIVDHPLHTPIIRGPLTKNLPFVFDDIVDEIKSAFVDVIGGKLDGNEWVNVNTALTSTIIISRASNRLFVGLPLCRNEEYLRAVRQFTFNVIKGRRILAWFPIFMQGLVGPFLPWARRATHGASKYVRPLIEERQKWLTQGIYGHEKPNDYLMWITEEAMRRGESIEVIIGAIMVSNFTSTHTSSSSMTQAIYQLAGNPAYASMLREEVESAIEEYGWSKVAMGKMQKLDSFLRESQRINGITHLSILRGTLQDTTLSDGTFIPSGTVLAGTSTATHRDPRNYTNPDVFEPLRFLKIINDGGADTKQQFVSASPDYVPFGLGKHVCPGRFLAAIQMKLIMTYILLNYDVQFENGGGRPDSCSRWHTISPKNTSVMFRKRVLC